MFENSDAAKYIDRSQVFLFGRSLGGAVAANVALDDSLPFKGVIIENTFTTLGDLVDVMFPPLKYVKNFLLKSKFETIKIIGKIKKPLLFCRSQNDELIPKEQMDKFSKLVNGIVIPKKINDEDIYKPKEVYENDFDIHEEKNVILLRYFFELLIRVAFIKFSDDPNLTIGARAKMLFDILKSYFKSKKKSGVSNTLVMIASIDPRIHNPENSIESFISTHYISLEKIFSDLYSCSCNNENQYKRYDRTLTYRYFYENVILNSEELSKVFEDKLTYIDIITLFHKQRKITSANIDTLEVTNDEIFEYIESALEYEMIFREFCELIYLVSRKYFLFYGITLEEDEIKGNMEKKKDEEVKRKKTKLKKKFKKEEKEDGEVTNEVEIHSQIDHNHKVEDFYMRIINEVEKITNILLQKSKYEGINKYEFPILKNHKVIERLKEEERLRKLEEERKERDRQRYNKERMLLKEEDVNMYKEEEEEGTGSDEESEY